MSDKSSDNKKNDLTDDELNDVTGGIAPTTMDGGVDLTTTAVMPSILPGDIIKI